MLLRYHILLIIADILLLCTTVTALVKKQIGPPPVRVWLDEYVFRQGETNLMQRVINASDNTLIISGRTTSRILQPKGHTLLHKHDILWSGRTACYAAFRDSKLSPTNLISCTPGTEAITGKAAFVETLNAAYGREAAGAIAPLGFPLPSHYPAFVQHLRNTGTSGVWAFKTDEHRGKGVVAVEGYPLFHQALTLTAVKNTPAPKKPVRTLPIPQPLKIPKLKFRYVMAQKFIDDQLIINNRPGVLRLWAVVAGGNPVARAYLFEGGIMPFGNERSVNKHSGDLIVNIFTQNRSEAVDPWSVQMLRQYLRTVTGSDKAFHSFWDTIQRSTAAAIAATIPSVRRETDISRMKMYQGGNVEVLGLDFVLDTSFRPWLVEVNYLPSFARKVINCVMNEEYERIQRGGGGMSKKLHGMEVCQNNPMDEEKERFLKAHLHTLAAWRSGIESNIEQAQNAVNMYTGPHNRKNRRCTKVITAQVVRQVLDAHIVAAAASKHGLTDLTPLLYQSILCTFGDVEACELALPRPRDQSCGLVSVPRKVAIRIVAALGRSYHWLLSSLATRNIVIQKSRPRTYTTLFALDKAKNEALDRVIAEYWRAVEADNQNVGGVTRLLSYLGLKKSQPSATQVLEKLCMIYTRMNYTNNTS